MRNNKSQPKRRAGPKPRRRYGAGLVGPPTQQQAKNFQAMANRAVMDLNSNSRAMNNRENVFSGSDYIGPITVLDNTTGSDKIRKTIEVSPSSFIGTRLTRFAALYERYRFTSFRVRYVPAVPTALGCQLMCYIDTDPTDDPAGITDPDALIRMAMAHTGAQQWSFNTSKAIYLPMRQDKQLYYTGATKTNERFNLQGKIFFIQITDPINFGGSPITVPTLVAGSLFMDWTVSFQQPQLSIEAVQPFGTDPNSPYLASKVISFQDLDASTLAVAAPDTDLNLLLVENLFPNSRYMVRFSYASGIEISSATTMTGNSLDLYAVVSTTPTTYLKGPVTSATTSFNARAWCQCIVRTVQNNMVVTYNDKEIAGGINTAYVDTDQQGRAYYNAFVDSTENLQITGGGFALTFTRIV